MEYYYFYNKDLAEKITKEGKKQVRKLMKQYKIKTK